MVWDQLSINKPHLVYIILGGFTSIFMLCSSVIKERLYIGEATVATLVGIIFGPHAANLINPDSWGNTDQITLEFSRIVLVVQCFAVGVELPKYYMEKHWRSVVFLLVPVMTFGWLVTSLFIWAMFNSHLNWLDSLVCAACVTATDPVLASSVVGKGKFAKRVPKHLRDLLSAESGCNDGMAFPFIYLGLYLIKYRPDANEVAFHWFCNTVLYECIWGATYGVVVGYIARRAIRYAHEHDLIDRESFLVFYFVLALFCAGSGSILGMDDLLIGFACGVGFSNDGWFLEKTEEAHVSNVIDLLINLAFFVYFGTIIPWEQYNSAVLGISPWRLVVLALLVLFFRRIPVMLALKPLIPDVKTWREALFAGHFGPIGVGALFVAILARAELENETTTPLAVLPGPNFPHDNIIELIWPITTFLVLTSIIVHGSSIAVFTLGKHINTLTISLSYTKDNDQNNWMDRLPRIQSRSKSQMSKDSGASSDLEEKMPDFPAAIVARNFLRRQKEEDNPSRAGSRPGSIRASKRKKRWDSGLGPGGPVDPSAIAPRVRRPLSVEKVGSDTTTAVPSPDNEKGERRSVSQHRGEPEELYQEGDDTIIEDAEGNVLEVVHSNPGDTREQKEDDLGREVRRLMSGEGSHYGVTATEQTSPLEGLRHGAVELGQDVQELAQGKQGSRQRLWSRFGGLAQGGSDESRAKAAEPPERKRGPARAFKIGNTIIVEDEDGEVIKKYDIPPAGDRKQSYVDPEKTRRRLQRMGTWMGMSGQESMAAMSDSQGPKSRNAALSDDDEQIRFTMEGNTRRMSKADFIKQLQELDPRHRAVVVEDSNVPEEVKREARDDAAEHDDKASRVGRREVKQGRSVAMVGNGARLEKVGSRQDRPKGDEGTLVDEDAQDIPVHSFSQELHRQSQAQPTAAERRRRAASKQAKAADSESDSEDDGTERILPARRGRGVSPMPAHQASSSISPQSRDEETPTERRRRQAALRITTGGPEEETSAERRRREAALSPMREEQEPPDTPLEERETAAERRRRLAALGVRREEDESEEDEGRPRKPPKGAVYAGGSGTSSEAESGGTKARGIRFSDEPLTPRTFGNIRWGVDRGR